MNDAKKNQSTNHALVIDDEPANRDFLERLLQDGAGLKRAAESALGHGKPDAAERLADLVEKTMNTERL